MLSLLISSFIFSVSYFFPSFSDRHIIAFHYSLLPSFISHWVSFLSYSSLQLLWGLFSISCLHTFSSSWLSLWYFLLFLLQLSPQLQPSAFSAISSLFGHRLLSLLLFRISLIFFSLTSFLLFRDSLLFSASLFDHFFRFSGFLGSLFFDSHFLFHLFLFWYFIQRVFAFSLQSLIQLSTLEAISFLFDFQLFSSSLISRPSSSSLFAFLFFEPILRFFFTSADYSRYFHRFLLLLSIWGFFCLLLLLSPALQILIPSSIFLFSLLHYISFSSFILWCHAFAFHVDFLHFLRLSISFLFLRCFLIPPYSLHSFAQPSPAPVIFRQPLWFSYAAASSIISGFLHAACFLSSSFSLRIFFFPFSFASYFRLASCFFLKSSAIAAFHYEQKLITSGFSAFDFFHFFLLFFFMPFIIDIFCSFHTIDILRFR